MIHIVQIDPAVPPGRIPDVLSELGCKYIVWYAWMPDFPENMPDGDALVVLGGIMGADDEKEHPYLKSVCIWIIEALDKKLPVLGICLGAQLLAKLSGGRLLKNTYGEKGCMSVDLTEDGSKDALFSGFPSIWPVFQWHNDSFVPPVSSKILCVSSICSFQAFRLGENAYGVQFHPEVTPLMAHSWVGEAANGDEKLLAFRAYYSEYRMWARRFLFNFFRFVV